MHIQRIFAVQAPYRHLLGPFLVLTCAAAPCFSFVRSGPFGIGQHSILADIKGTNIHARFDRAGQAVYRILVDKFLAVTCGGPLLLSCTRRVLLNRTSLSPCRHHALIWIFGIFWGVNVGRRCAGERISCFLPLCRHQTAEFIASRTRAHKRLFSEMRWISEKSPILAYFLVDCYPNKKASSEVLERHGQDDECALDRRQENLSW